MAGLVTAWLLREVGHNVTVFEAGPLAGGRVKTIRFGKGEPYAEAGAMRIPRSHSLTTWLTEDLFGLQTWKFNSADENALYYINNEQCRSKDYVKNNCVFRFALTPREKEFKPASNQGLAEALFERCLNNLIWYELRIPGIKVGELRSLPSGKIKLVRRGFDRFSLSQFLMEKSFLEVSESSSGKRPKPIPDSKLSQAARDFITLVLGLEMHLSCSLLAVIDDYLVLHGDDEMRQIQYGMDYLPRAFLGVPAPGLFGDASDPYAAADRTGQAARTAAIALRQFLQGLAHLSRAVLAEDEDTRRKEHYRPGDQANMLPDKRAGDARREYPVGELHVGRR